MAAVYLQYGILSYYHAYYWEQNTPTIQLDAGGTHITRVININFLGVSFSFQHSADRVEY